MCCGLDGNISDPNPKTGLGVWMSDVGIFENHIFYGRFIMDEHGP